MPWISSITLESLQLLRKNCSALHAMNCTWNHGIRHYLRRRYSPIVLKLFIDDRWVIKARHYIVDNAMWKIQQLAGTTTPLITAVHACCTSIRSINQSMMRLDAEVIIIRPITSARYRVNIIELIGMTSCYSTHTMQHASTSCCIATLHHHCIISFIIIIIIMTRQSFHFHQTPPSGSTACPIAGYEQGNPRYQTLSPVNNPHLLIKINAGRKTQTIQ